MARPSPSDPGYIGTFRADEGHAYLPTGVKYAVWVEGWDGEIELSPDGEGILLAWNGGIKAEVSAPVKTKLDPYSDEGQAYVTLAAFSEIVTRFTYLLLP